MDEQVRARLISGFLREAWEGLAGLETSLTGLATAQGEAAREALVLLGHRLKGSAGLYGFPQLAGLAGQVERLAQRLASGAAGGGVGTAAERSILARTLELLPELLERIARDGQEDHPALAALHRGFAELLAQPTAAAPQDLLDPPSAAQVDRQLRDFRSAQAEVLSYFGPEAEEHLEGMGQSLAQLATQPDHRGALTDLFRQAHTLKGAAFTVGCTPMGELAHRMEDLIVAVREQGRALAGPARQALLRATETLRLALAVLRGAEISVADDTAAAHSALAACAESLALPEASTAPAAGHEPGLTLAADVTPKTAAPIPPLLPDEPTAEAVETMTGGADPFPAGVGGFRSTIRVNLERMDQLLNLVGELVIARRRFELDLEQLNETQAQLTASHARMQHTLQEFVRLNPGRDSPSPRPLAPRPELPAELLPLGDIFAELEFDRYDDVGVLAHRLGEISADVATVQADASASIGRLRQDASQLRQLTQGLRDGISRARMVPIGQLFTRFTRLVEKLAAENSKEVVITVVGENVEIDNAIVERIVDPLMHLVQNAVIHGLELPANRVHANKPAAGNLFLGAYPRGNFVHLEVEDDGRGIDLEQLKESAVAQGLKRRDEVEMLSDEEALELIYLPGLSTSPEVTTAAGRGIGMNVVWHNVLRLNGEVAIETEVGVGTRFTLKLPLTLIVSEALMVRVGEEIFAVPAPAIKRLLQLPAGSTLAHVGTVETPLTWLHRLFHLPRARTTPELPVVLLQSGGRLIALAVDELLGLEEIVIKPLGLFLEGLQFFAGATISADGRVIPLLDPMAFAALAPGAEHAEDPEPPRAEPEEIAATSTAEQPTILLVDDSLSVRRILGETLRQAGFAVKTASDGVEALEAIRETSLVAVITDLEMPRLNGYELIEHVRRLPQTRALPIMVITTRAGAKHAQLAARLGATRYLSKPIEQAVLIAELRAMLTPSSQSSTSAASNH